MRFGQIVLGFYEDGIPSKTGGYEESIPFVWCCHAWFLPDLESLKSSRAEEDLLWRFNIKQLGELPRPRRELRALREARSSHHRAGRRGRAPWAVPLARQGLANS